jgi:DNA-binding transcriptional ArsR family regulator
VARPIGDTGEAILEFLVDSGRPMSAKELAERLGGDGPARRGTITSALHALRDRGLVELWKPRGTPLELNYDLTVHVVDTGSAGRGGMSMERAAKRPEKRGVQRRHGVDSLMAALPGHRIDVSRADGTSVRICLSEPGMDFDRVKVFLEDGRRLTNVRAKKLADQVIRSAARAIREPDEPSHAYAEAVGRRLRQVRKQEGLTLLAVAETSNGEFKVSALGAYERGERVISVLRLQRLAELYQVPVDHLLPTTATTAR